MTGYLVIVLQNAVLAIVIGRFGANARADRCLAGAMIASCGMTLDALLEGYSVYLAYPRFSALPLNIGTVIGPLIYAYCHTLVLGQMPRAWGWHMVLPAAHFAYEASGLLSPLGAGAPWSDGILEDGFRTGTIISLAAYSLMAVPLLAEYRHWLAENRSDDDRFSALWLSRLLWLTVATSLFAAALQIATWVRLDLPGDWRAAFTAWLTAGTAFVGIEAWRNSCRPFPAMAPEPQEPQALIPQPDWESRGEAWQARIRQEEWWRESSLTLSETARRLGTNEGYLSRAFNIGLGVSFSDLVNGLRAAEVARRIDQRTKDIDDLLALAFEAGFGSKATFNRVFKSAYGVSPSEYRDRARLNS